MYVLVFLCVAAPSAAMGARYAKAAAAVEKATKSAQLKFDGENKIMQGGLWTGRYMCVFGVDACACRVVASLLRATALPVLILFQPPLANKLGCADDCSPLLLFRLRFGSRCWQWGTGNCSSKVTLNFKYANCNCSLHMRRTVRHECVCTCLCVWQLHWLE